MRTRVVVAGVLAGLTVFVWSFVSHELLPLGEAGVSALPDQYAVLDGLAAGVPDAGFYFFPFETDAAKMEEAFRTRPRGILVLTPASEPFHFGRALATEAATNVLAGLLAAFVLAAVGPLGWGRRLAFGAALGAFASLSIDFSYWNWYGFPTEYLASQLLDQVLGWSLAALLAGWWLARKVTVTPQT
jgi:hypothetical protein